MMIQISPPPIVSYEEQELAQQLGVSRFVLDAMGGSLPFQHIVASQLTTALDVVCRCGSWALDVAATYPFLHVTGIDTSGLCVAYAQCLANAQGLVNANFQVQDMRTLASGPFAADSFDLINVAFVAPTLLTTDYAALMQSLFRLCRPGGSIRWMEMELPLTNSTAFEQFTALICRALDAAGQTFVSPDMQRSAAIFDDWRRSQGVQVTPSERRNLGITPMMSGWLREAGCWNVEAFPIPLDVSAGTPAHTAFVSQVEVFGQQVAPFLCERGVTTTEALTHLLSRMMEELEQDDFCGLCLVLTLYGYKGL